MTFIWRENVGDMEWKRLQKILSIPECFPFAFTAWWNLFREALHIVCWGEAPAQHILLQFCLSYKKKHHTVSLPEERVSLRRKPQYFSDNNCLVKEINSSCSKICSCKTGSQRCLSMLTLYLPDGNHQRHFKAAKVICLVSVVHLKQLLSSAVFRP